MTISSHSHAPSVLDKAVPATQELRATDTRAAWRIWAMLMIAIGAIYLLMFNPYWVPGGDSELYIAVGRSWATGLRHTFNGQFVSISPPGWPLLMAAAMKISPTFGLLKLLTIACMTFTMGFWYWFLIRFTTPKNAALLTLLCAIISHVYSLSFWMHSDAMFCLLATAAMVVACQINEGKPHLIWRVILLSLLCIGAQLVRWAGALQWIMVGGVLMAGQSLPLLWRLGEWRSELQKFRTRQWAAVAVSLGVTVGTFAILRHELHLTAQEAADAQDAGVTFDEQQMPEAKTVDIFNGKQSTKLTFTQEMTKRVRDSGKWFSWLFWPEMRFVGGSGVKGLLNSLDCLIGWLIIAALFICGWTNLKRCQWMWLAVFVYCAFLCLNWPNPNARYLVPVLPIVLWGTIEGIRIIFAHYSRMKWGSRLVIAMLASIALANSALLAVDVWVARSHDFYARYEGGMNQGLISSVRYLNARGLGDGDLAVSEIYTNLGKRRISKAGLRAAVMLSDVVVKSVPDKVGDDPTRGKFLAWARSKHIKWYLYQAPISPWRLWHFRVPAWLQKSLSHEEVPPESGGWILYRYVSPVNSFLPLPMSQVVTLVPGKWVKVEVPTSHHWPTRVPGM
jgi:hypothetical protein